MLHVHPKNVLLFWMSLKYLNLSSLKNIAIYWMLYVFRKSSWIVYYHVVKNGTYQKPSSYSPINWTLFNSKHHFTTVDGHKLDFAWSWYGKHNYIGYSQSGSLFLQTWVPPSLYGSFAGWLKWYYERFYKGNFIFVLENYNFGAVCELTHMFKIVVSLRNCMSFFCQDLQLK